MGTSVYARALPGSTSSSVASEADGWTTTTVGVAASSVARLRAAPAVEQAEHRGHEDERRDRGAQQAADDRPAERRVLLAALTQPERHRDHADDHGERGHQHGAEARRPRLDG